MSTATSAAPTVTAADLEWGATPAPTWPTSKHILAAAIALLPTVDNDTVAATVEALAVALVERDDQITALDEQVSVLLDQQHQHQREIKRLKARVYELVDAQRLTARHRVSA